MTPERRPASLAARAGLFVALSALAVPACQHFDGTDKPDREQSARLGASDAREPVVGAHRPSVPRG
jgi:hypothetical protein